MDKMLNNDRWTPEQLRAITESGCSLLVAAAAGAGKTAVLVERIIRRITQPQQPVDIDRLLIVTFTNAAAAEMRERIGAALNKLLEAAASQGKAGGSQDDRQVQQLHRQLVLLGRTQITTIHSFCLEVIRGYFHRIDLDPGFRIADETESVLLKLEAAEELFEERYESEALDEAFLKLVECYSGSKDDQRLLDTVLTIYDFVRSHPHPDAWLQAAADAFKWTAEQGFDGTPWGEILKGSIRTELSGLADRMEKAVMVLKKAPGLESYLPNYRNELSMLQELMMLCNKEAGGWRALCQGFEALHFDRLPRCGKDADPVSQELVREIRNEVKKKLDRIKGELAHADAAEMGKEMSELHPMMQYLCNMVWELGQRYTAKKKTKGLVDFNDLEHYCLEILEQTGENGVSATDAALELRQRYEEIYIDEYQDSNMIQEVILNLLSRKEEGRPNLFMVGDVKQSIYRFRQAKPELFIQKSKTYSPEAAGLYRIIKLYKNFRSRENIINAVNDLFTQLMSEGIGEIEYNEEEALFPGARFDEPEDEGITVGGAVELHIIDMKEAGDEGAAGEEDTAAAENGEEPAEGVAGLPLEEGDKPDNIRSEAILAAERIKSLTEGGDDGKPLYVFDRDAGKYRPASYKDIVILMRATKNWTEVFTEELSMRGIPVYSDVGSGYFKTVEVMTILSLLQIIDNPMQDIPLLSVLRSPIGGFMPEELIDIRLEDRKLLYYAALKKAAEQQSAAGLKAAAFLKRLEEWRLKAAHMSTDELLWYLYTDTGYYGFVGAMPGGLLRQANLRLLFDRARRFEETSLKGLFSFISFIDKLKSSSGDLGSAKMLGEKDDVVRIMSIHKSKGLEFPVVFVCGTGKSFNLMDTSKAILLHQELGFGPDFVDYRRRIAYPTPHKQALRYKIRLESLSEEMRILYVAFTRAKEKLILTGSVKDMEKAAAKWSGCMQSQDEKLKPHEVLRGSSFLDWLAMSLIRHQDGELAKRLGLEGGYGAINNRSRWDIRVWNREQLIQSPAEEEAALPDFIKELTELEAAAEQAVLTDELMGAEKDAASLLQKAIAEKLTWEYPYRHAETLPAKLTVTELKRLFEDLDEDNPPPAAVSFLKKPRYLEVDKGLSAAEKGTVMHFVMQHLDFLSSDTEAHIRAQVENMTQMELLTATQAETVDMKKILRFFGTPLGRRMKTAEKLYREAPFNVELRTTELYPELPAARYAEETLLLQGVIDCYFDEGDGLVLVDYKTDYVPQGEADQIKARYDKQIGYYAAALKQITGKPVKEKYIYLFWNGEILSY